MTRTQLANIWRNLWFWQRALLECSLTIPVFLLLELMLPGRTGNFAGAALEGLAFGLFYAIIDHAFFAPKRKRSDGAFMLFGFLEWYTQRRTWHSISAMSFRS
jgi:hypothetical protein